MRRRERIVAQARALVGVPFRLHGRRAEHGLDCVGLVALAFRRAGHRGVTPEHYALRGGDPEALRNGWVMPGCAGCASGNRAMSCWCRRGRCSSTFLCWCPVGLFMPMPGCAKWLKRRAIAHGR